MVCRLNTGECIEEHHEFWILVAGKELVWRDFTDNIENKVAIPGANEKEYIGKYKDTIGTVVGRKLFAAVKDKRAKSAV